MAAFGDTGEHRRAGHKTRRGDVPGIPDDPGLYLQPFMFGDDDGHGNLLPLLLGPLHAVADVVNAVIMNATIGRAVEDAFDVGDVPLASAQGGTRRVQVADDFLVSHRTLANADPLHPVYLLDEQCFRRLDGQLLFSLGPSHLGDLRGVAKRRDRSVPEASLGVSSHRVHCKFRRLTRLVFVEVR
ncbi:MAG: hypothetical protein H2054_09075 [Sphingomonas sp.]|nr:hypothetical protein [Sphingomonas sp.]